MRKYNVIALILALVLAVTGCADGKLPDERSEQEKRQESFGKLFGDDLFVFGQRRDRQDEAQSATRLDSSIFQVSSYLWIASLEVMDFMPLLQADRSSGIILTDWYNSAEHKDERFKIDVKITSRTLRSDGIQVRVFQQRLQDNLWVDKVVPLEISRSVEDAILDKARLLRTRSE